jgi:hypothetical protein
VAIVSISPNANRGTSLSGRFSELLLKAKSDSNAMGTSVTDDPLLDLAASYALAADPNITPDALSCVRLAVEKYIRGTLAFQEAALLLAGVMGQNQVLNQIDQVLRTPLTPIPDHAGSPEDSDTGRRAKTRPWSSYEDQRLLAALHRFGFGDWASIAGFVGNSRTKSQCYQRWTRGIDPSIDKAKWSPEEDFRLLVLVAQHGERSWAKISSGMANRCDVQCRYRFRQLSKGPNFGPTFARARQAARGAIVAPVGPYFVQQPVQIFQVMPQMAFPVFPGATWEVPMQNMVPGTYPPQFFQQPSAPGPMAFLPAASSEVLQCPPAAVMPPPRVRPAGSMPGFWSIPGDPNPPVHGTSSVNIHL